MYSPGTENILSMVRVIRRSRDKSLLIYILRRTYSGIPIRENGSTEIKIDNITKFLYLPVEADIFARLELIHL